MYRGLTVSVVVPAFNEAASIAGAIHAVPGFVDHVLVVDDASRDRTGARALGAPRPGLEILRHRENRGVGAAIVTGYRRALELGVDVAAVMAGDGQMHPADLPALLDPIAEGRADYTKGNRFLCPDVWRAMPPSRIAGNIVLSLLTRAASGYWDLFDSQCGYTAASRRALLALELHRLFPRYGYPNDLLARLHVAGARVLDVPVRPIYGPGWKSGIRVSTVFRHVLPTVVRAWARRLSEERRGASRPLAPVPPPPLLD